LGDERGVNRDPSMSKGCHFFLLLTPGFSRVKNEWLSEKPFKRFFSPCMDSSTALKRGANLFNANKPAL
jgi:hypothetical protein